MSAILDGETLTLTGDVGDFGFADHFTAGDVLLALASVDDAAAMTVRLNSGGGYATEGAAIHAILSRRSGTTDVVIDGIAASAASLIAMAGETVSMSAGAVMMIHDPAAFTMGDAGAHEKSIEGLEALATAYARIYAEKSGKTPAEARAIMKATSWFTPEEAVAAGFADEAIGAKSKPVAAFDYRAYAHAPRRLTALAAKKDWRLPDHKPTAQASASTRKETAMSRTEREELEALRSEKKARETADAIMALDEAEGLEDQAAELGKAGVSVEQAKAILSAGQRFTASGSERRLNGQGLGGPDRMPYGAGLSVGSPVPGRQSRQGGSSLAATMRARHGGKEA